MLHKKKLSTAVQLATLALVTSNALYSPNQQGEIMVLRYQNFSNEDSKGIRSADSFRRDLEQLWAAGYYPVNLRDLAVGKAKYKQDLATLRLSGWQPVESVEPRLVRVPRHAPSAQVA